MRVFTALAVIIGIAVLPQATVAAGVRAKAKTAAKARAKARARQPVPNGVFNTALKDVFAELQSVAQLTGKVAKTMAVLAEQQPGAVAAATPVASFPTAVPVPEAPEFVASYQDRVDPQGGASLLGTPLVEELPPQDLTGKYVLPGSQPAAVPPPAPKPLPVQSPQQQVPQELAFLLPPNPTAAPAPKQTAEQIMQAQEADSASVAEQLAALAPAASMELERDSQRSKATAEQSGQTKVAPVSRPRHQETLLDKLWRSPKPGSLMAKAKTAEIAAAAEAAEAKRETSPVPAGLSDNSVWGLFRPHAKVAPSEWGSLVRVNASTLFNVYQKKMKQLKVQRTSGGEDASSDDGVAEDDDSGDADAEPGHGDAAPPRPEFDSTSAVASGPRRAPLPPADPQAALEQLVSKAETASLPDYSADLRSGRIGYMPLPAAEPLPELEVPGALDDAAHASPLPHTSAVQPPTPATVVSLFADARQVQTARPWDAPAPPPPAPRPPPLPEPLERGTGLWRPRARGYNGFRASNRDLRAIATRGDVFSAYKARLRAAAKQYGAPVPRISASPVFDEYRRRLNENIANTIERGLPSGQVAPPTRFQEPLSSPSPQSFDAPSRYQPAMSQPPSQFFDMAARPQEAMSQPPSQFFDMAARPQQAMSFPAARRPFQQVSRLFDGGIRAAAAAPPQRFFSPLPRPAPAQYAFAANPETPVGHASRFFASSPGQQRFPALPAMPAAEFAAAPSVPAMPGRDFAAAAPSFRTPRADPARVARLFAPDGVPRVPAWQAAPGRRPSSQDGNVFQLYRQRLGAQNVAARPSGGVLQNYRRRLAALQAEQSQQPRQQPQGATSYLQLPVPQDRILEELSGPQPLPL